MEGRSAHGKSIQSAAVRDGHVPNSRGGGCAMVGRIPMSPNHGVRIHFGRYNNWANPIGDAQSHPAPDVHDGSRGSAKGHCLSSAWSTGFRDYHHRISNRHCTSERYIRIFKLLRENCCTCKRCNGRHIFYFQPCLDVSYGLDRYVQCIITIFPLILCVFRFICGRMCVK